MRTWRLASLLLLLSGYACAGIPDWFRQAAGQPLPAYPPNTNVVVLLDEGKTTVKDSGEIRGDYRMVYKILRTQGRGIAQRSFCFREDTRVTYLKAWSITATGVEFELKQKDAVEKAMTGIELYSDARCLEVDIPGADTGSVVGFEFEQKKRPFILQDGWQFQELYPVRLSRLVLQLPSGWEYKVHWMNHESMQPTDLGGNQFAFELRDLPAIEPEPLMPAVPAVGVGIDFQYLPPTGNFAASWEGIGGWEAGLLAGRREPTPAMQQKVAELTAGLKSPLEKIRALSNYVQQDVRYVAIAIGIGGYQPHPAGDVFINRYGDCKDKATLLGTMLKIAGIDSNWVLVNTERGFITPDHPSVAFDHVILAIRLPQASTEGLYAVADVPGIGKVLYFDPTYDLTPFGNLPGSEQSNYGLLVTEKSGVLVKLPLVSGDQNRLQRTMTISVQPLGSITGQVHEVFTGSRAADRRAIFRNIDPAHQRKWLEGFLAEFLPSFDLVSFDVKNLDQLDQPLTLTYSFNAKNYVKSAGNLLLVRPRVLGEKSTNLFEDRSKGERHYPVEFETLLLDSDHVEISLPAGYIADEVPDAVSLDSGPVSYISTVQITDNVIHYDREYRVKDVFVGTEKLQALKKFYRQLAGEEQNSVVLKKN